MPANRVVAIPASPNVGSSVPSSVVASEREVVVAPAGGDHASTRLFHHGEQLPIPDPRGHDPAVPEGWVEIAVGQVASKDEPPALAPPTTSVPSSRRTAEDADQT